MPNALRAKKAETYNMKMLNTPSIQHNEIERKYEKILSDLREKEEFNFALFNYSPHTTVVVDRQGRVVKSNAAKLRSSARLPEIGDRMYLDYASHHLIDMRKELMDCIKSGEKRFFSALAYRNCFLDITIAPFPQGALIISEDVTRRKQAEDDRSRLIEALQKALEEVEQLRELLPICSACKKIRDDENNWQQLEAYLNQRAHIHFTHGICPECAKSLYSELIAGQG